MDRLDELKKMADGYFTEGLYCSHPYRAADHDRDAEVMRWAVAEIERLREAVVGIGPWMSAAYTEAEGCSEFLQAALKIAELAGEIELRKEDG